VEGEDRYGSWVEYSQQYHVFWLSLSWMA
jgi:hypothetical protein